jgi:hypothetical protein
MSERFGYDFSHVRVHADSQAAESARAVHALAYTVGRDVVFGRGHYSPHTDGGQRLLAHELTHVVQNRDVSGGGPIEIGSPTSHAENEATAAAASRQMPIVHNAASVLQRQPQTPTKQSCAGWTCLTDLNKCDNPDPGKEGNGQTSTSFSLTVMIDVDVPTPGEVGPTTFGHSYVKFNESNGAEYTYGFYPRTKAEVSILGTSPTPGCIVHPDLSHFPCIDYTEKYSLTKAEYDKALGNAKLWCHSNPNYHLYDVNCTTFVAKVAEAGGKTLPTYRGKVTKAGITADNPNTLLESLQARDKANAPPPKVEAPDPVKLATEIVGMIRFYQTRWVFSRLNQMWMAVMLDVLAEVHKMKYLESLFQLFATAEDVNKPRLMTAMRAAKLKAATPKPTPEQVDEILAISPDLPDMQKKEIRAFLNR